MLQDEQINYPLTKLTKKNYCTKTMTIIIIIQKAQKISLGI